MRCVACTGRNTERLWCMPMLMPRAPWLALLLRCAESRHLVVRRAAVCHVHRPISLPVREAGTDLEPMFCATWAAGDSFTHAAAPMCTQAGSAAMPLPSSPKRRCVMSFPVLQAARRREPQAQPEAECHAAAHPQGRLHLPARQAAQVPGLLLSGSLHCPAGHATSAEQPRWRCVHHRPFRPSLLA